MKICVIPIDNRPVCYDLFKHIVAIDESLELFLPDKNLMGDLVKAANIEELFNWLENLPETDSIIISLDTIAYGGLISSRRCPESFEEIKKRIEKLKKILVSKNSQIYAFSSIMRISDNNINQEEKKYWDKYGKKIFDYSFHTHKNGCESCIQTQIPSEIIEDYLNTRKRNFEINKIYLDWQKEGIFNTLVFSKDDCAEYGFNVQEANFLKKSGGFIKTGADEIPLSLFARAIQGNLKVCPLFLEPKHKDLISNYEDISIENSVLGQLSLANVEVSDEKTADIILIINNFENNQGEIVMKKPTKSFSGKLNLPKKPFMIADVRFANGADNAFVTEFFKQKIDDKFCGYSAWNTSANTLGSLICAAKIKFLAKKYNSGNFKKLQTMRLLDDWAYQANVRQTLTKPEKLNMQEYEHAISEFLNYNFEAEYNFPWKRLFEIEVIIK